MALVDVRRGGLPERPGPPVGGSEDHGPASMDLRLPVPLLWAGVLCFVLGAVLARVGTQILSQVVYSAEVRLLAVDYERTRPGSGIALPNRLLQSIQLLATSDAYVDELARRAGVEPDLDRIGDMITVVRPSVSAVVLIGVRGGDQAEVEALGEQIVPALDALVDRAREGASPLLQENSRDAPGLGGDGDYTGPLYADPFGGRPDFGVQAPRLTYNTLVGGVLGVIVLFGLALGSHARSRVTTDEDLDLILSLPQLARVPRLGVRRRSRIDHHLKGVALALDARCPGDLGRLGLLGVGVPRTRARLHLALAAALAATMDRNVVIVDLDVESAPTSRRLGLVSRLRRRIKPGLSDAVADGLAPEPFVSEVPVRRFPRPVRSMLRRAEHRVYALGVGSRVGERSFGDEQAVVEAVRVLARHALVVAALPRVPGPTPVQGILNDMDVNALVLLDGWSELPDAQAAAAVLDATAADRSGYLLIEN